VAVLGIASCAGASAVYKYLSREGGYFYAALDKEAPASASAAELTAAANMS
jgi:hypothetical protein